MSSTTTLNLKLTGRDEVSEGTLLLVLTSVDGSDLPEWTPGAHLDIKLPSGLWRQYSLCGEPHDSSSYSVCVLREENGRGGSLEIHRDLHLGSTVEAREPRNHFPLVEADDYLLIAGGIGVTPIEAMVEELHRRGASWRLVYGGRSLASMAFLKELQALDPQRVTLVPQDTEGLLDVPGLIASVGEGTQVYCCGPTGLLDAVTGACEAIGIGGRLHIEAFTASGTIDPAVEGDDQPIEVELAETGVTITVPAGQTILDAVAVVGLDVPSSCQEGYCGSCETRVLGGTPDHRGTYMSPEEFDEEGTMLICVGRAKTPNLVLDL